GVGPLQAASPMILLERRAGTARLGRRQDKIGTAAGGLRDDDSAETRRAFQFRARRLGAGGDMLSAHRTGKLDFTHPRSRFHTLTPGTNKFYASVAAPQQSAAIPSL